jgi:hypothetical protein
MRKYLISLLAVFSLVAILAPTAESSYDVPLPMGGAVGGTTAASTVSLTSNAAITGVLPAANQAPEVCGGDMSGTAGVCVVASIAGSSPITVTPNALQWVAGATPSITQATQTSDIATSGVTITSQAGYASALTTHKIGGRITLMSPAASNSGTVTGAIVFGAGGANQMSVAPIGLIQGNGNASIYFAAAVGSEGTGNYSFLGDGSTLTALNAPTSGSVALRINNTTVMSVSSASVTFSQATLPTADNGTALGGGGQRWSDLETYTASLKGALDLNSSQTIACSTGGTFNVAATPSPGLIVTSGTLSSNCTIAFATNASNGLYHLDMSGVTLGASFGVVFTNGTATKTYTTASVIGGTLATVWTHGANTMAVNF